MDYYHNGSDSWSGHGQKCSKYGSELKCTESSVVSISLGLSFDGLV